jgi:hypothetical protein
MGLAVRQHDYGVFIQQHICNNSHEPAR